MTFTPIDVYPDEVNGTADKLIVLITQFAEPETVSDFWRDINSGPVKVLSNAIKLGVEFKGLAEHAKAMDTLDAMIAEKIEEHFACAITIGAFHRSQVGSLYNRNCIWHVVFESAEDHAALLMRV